MNILFWNPHEECHREYRVHKFRYNILFISLMDRGRAPHGIGHLMILEK